MVRDHYPHPPMKLLQLCKKFPYPLRDGESMAVTYLAKALQSIGCEITLLAMNTSKHRVKVSDLESNLAHYRQVHHIEIDNEVKPLHAFLNLFSSDSYNISRFDNENFRARLKQLLQSQKYDLVQLESLYLAPYIDIIRRYSDAKIVLRAHNVEHEIWERMAANEVTALRRWYFEYSARKLKKYEIEQLQEIDYLLPISQVDQRKFQQLGYRGPSLTTPIGLDLARFEYEELTSDRPKSISFIGSLDWMPNIEGLNWFLEQVWPLIQTVFSDLELHIAGRNCPDWIQNLDIPNLVVHGEVDDSARFLKDHAISVVPLLSGSGMRAKIIEAMALGRVVLTTTVGLEGIPAKDKKQVLIADSVDQFVRQFQFIMRHTKHLPSMSRAARQLTEGHYDHLKIASTLVQSYGNVNV